jgi:hypothetical protein
MSQADTEPIVFSDDFPPDYGDFNIQSSDRVVFSFPRGVLSHVSPVFKDMYAFDDPNTGNDQVPLVVTEDAATLTQLFLYLDPLKVPAELTTDTIGPFLEVMMKYQIPDIQERLERIIIGKDGQLQGIYAEEPMLVLSLAEKFNLPKIGGIVMSYVVKAHRDRVFTTKYSLSSLTIMQIMELRTERGRKLSSRFFRFMEDKIEGIVYPHGSHPRYDPYYEPDDSESCLHNSKMLERQQHLDQPCLVCQLKCQLLGAHVAIRMQVEPSWSALISEMSENLPTKCSSCQHRLLADLPIKIPKTAEEEYRYQWDDDHSEPFNQLQTFVLSLESQPIPMKSLTPSTLMEEE